MILIANNAQMKCICVINNITNTILSLKLDFFQLNSTLLFLIFAALKPSVKSVWVDTADVMPPSESYMKHMLCSSSHKRHAPYDEERIMSAVVVLVL